MRSIKGIIVNPQNGEMVGHIETGDRILKAKSIEGVEIGRNEAYTKVYLKPMFELAKVLTGTEAQFVNYLMSYAGYASGILQHDNNKPLTREVMKEETGQDERTIDRILCALIEKQVIGKHKTGRSLIFTANPYIFMRGKRINETLYNLYKHTKWAKMHSG